MIKGGGEEKMDTEVLVAYYMTLAIIGVALAIAYVAAFLSYQWYARSEGIIDAEDCDLLDLLPFFVVAIILEGGIVGSLLAAIF